ncbi:MAG: uracil phosphoribosyltransferase [Micrococcales bacterium]|nr:uracil phosphoribosyltransferase [Micrococcales bacterium]
MRVHVAQHPLVAHKLTVLRDRTTPSPTFRALVDELVTLLAYEATRQIAVRETAIVTPVCPTVGMTIASPRPLVVPVLRAGLGMLDGMARLLPTAEVGFLGMRRDEETLEAVTYAHRLPDDLSGRQCFLLDPMLATGGTLVAAVDYLLARGARDVTAICLLATPEGLSAVERSVGARADVTVVVAAVDEGLDENAYIVPGLGDAGDRLYGVVGDLAPDRSL